jgi:hypothetical protein
MGLVIYVSRRTGEELQADFPLHPALVLATRPDGSQVQMMRDVWDQEWSQKVPDLPKVDPVATFGDAPPYEPPTVKPIGNAFRSALEIKNAQREPLPESHAAWFAQIYDQMVTIDKKLDQVIADLGKSPGVVDFQEQEPPPRG